MPCPSGDSPVNIVACAEHVTAGTTSRSGRDQPAPTSPDSLGAIGKTRPVRPTALITIRGGFTAEHTLRKLSAVSQRKKVGSAEFGVGREESEDDPSWASSPRSWLL